MDNEQYHDFLVTAGGTAGFIINRQQFTSSLYIESISDCATNAPNCRGTIQYGEKTLLLYDLHSRLETQFCIKIPGNSHLALIMPSALLGFRQKSFFNICAREKTDTSQLALQVQGYSAIEHIPLYQIKRLPDIMRKTFLSEGILGVRFTENQAIQIFIDIAVMTDRMIEETQ